MNENLSKKYYKIGEISLHDSRDPPKCKKLSRRIARRKLLQDMRKNEL